MAGPSRLFPKLSTGKRPPGVPLVVESTGLTRTPRGKEFTQVIRKPRPWPNHAPVVIDDPAQDRNPVDLLAEEFAERLRNGETPSITEFVERLPEHEAAIRSMFPSM